jgi:hypothetical protein
MLELQRLRLSAPSGGVVNDDRSQLVIRLRNCFVSRNEFTSIDLAAVRHDHIEPPL